MVMLVLQPNFRGSSGYGAAFRNAGFGEFGGKMISDINDGAAHLVETGLAKPGGYCVLGGSYGGYAALMSGLDHADGAKCVISINGVTNPFALLRGVDTGSSFTAYWQQYMGNLFTTTGAARDAITTNAAGERTDDASAASARQRGHEGPLWSGVRIFSGCERNEQCSLCHDGGRRSLSRLNGCPRNCAAREPLIPRPASPGPVKRLSYSALVSVSVVSVTANSTSAPSLGGSGQSRSCGSGIQPACRLRACGRLADRDAWH